MSRNFYEEMEKLYTEYLMNPNLNPTSQSHNWIQLQTRWYRLQILLYSLMRIMREEGNTVKTEERKKN